MSTALMRLILIGLVYCLAESPTVQAQAIPGSSEGPAASPSDIPEQTPAEDDTKSDTPVHIRTGQTGHRFDKALDAKSIKGKYLLYLPEAYGRDPDRKWPVIVFLHGSGERGTNLGRVRKAGLAKRAESDSDLPFIVLSPQCPADGWWIDTDVRLMVMAMLDDVLETYAADRTRVYLTGMSMGGFGTWDLAQQHPDRFAAIAPVCGGGNPYLQNRLKNTPAIVFHGGKDKNVPVWMAKQMAGALQGLGGTVQLIVFPDMGHVIWDKVYANPMIFQFLMRHTLPG